MPIPIPCPKCGRELKLPDRSLLGRKGKCPKCNYVFVLEEPPIVALELAKPDEEPAPVSPATPGRSALASTPVSRPASAQTEVRASPQPHDASKSPFANLGEASATVATRPSTSMPGSSMPASSIFGNSPIGIPADGLLPTFDSLSDLEGPTGSAAKLKQQQRKNARRRNIGLAVGALALVLVGSIALLVTWSPVDNSATSSGDPALQTNQGEEPDNDANSGSMTHDPQPRGKPISLQYIPAGAQVVLNLHPAELWKQNSLGEELRYCIPPIAKLIETTLFELFQRKPEQVDELLICLIPGLRGNLPEIAAVAHLVEEQKRSQLIEQLGQRTGNTEPPVYISGDRAYLIVDLKTLVVCPKNQSDEMVQAITERFASESIDPLLPLTDRSRHISAIFLTSTLALQDMWFPQNVRPFVSNALDWTGSDVESVAWSFHLKDDQFFSEILLRNKGATAKDKGAGAKKLEKSVRDKLDELAGTLVPSFQQMNPREAGKRMVIGRVPAMVEVFAMATTTDHGPQHVRLTTLLPDRAAPNLALGTLLAWDESTRTDFTKERIKPAATETSKVPELIVDRLKMKIDVDFRRTPFNEAFAFIAGEIGTPIEIDGDALKLGGFTKNIAQAFKMDATRTQDVILKIFEESKGVKQTPDKTLVVIVNETKKSLLITTLASATVRRLTPLELVPSTPN